MKNEKLKVELTPELVNTTYDEISDALSYLDLKKKNDPDFFNRYVCACVRMKIEEVNEKIAPGTEQQRQPMTAVKENLTAVEIAKRTASCLWMTVICMMVFFAMCANSYIISFAFIIVSATIGAVGYFMGPKWLHKDWQKVFDAEV